MDFFSPESGSPESALEIMMIPLLFLAFGVIAYSASNRYLESEGKRPKWMPIVYVAFGFALLFGMQRFMFTRDILYANTLVTGKIRYSHYIALGLPLLTTIGIGIREFMRKRTDAERLY
ncbi:MAG: hypothetical protein QE269_03890 [Fimbriimonas sp.]|jgi:NADH:ubiquinone oxidoreductase subunit 5 (subunit L)/multisubunit Na+/H+ antiporter MnhA subunit|nr:hypothetical protein [Fimbriimonas sp.]